MISKNSKKDNVEISIKVPFGKNRKFAKTAFNVNQLDEQILIARISALDKKSYTKSGAKYEKNWDKIYSIFLSINQILYKPVWVIGKILSKLK